MKTFFPQKTIGLIAATILALLAVHPASAAQFQIPSVGPQNPPQAQPQQNPRLKGMGLGTKHDELLVDAERKALLQRNAIMDQLDRANEDQRRGLTANAGQSKAQAVKDMPRQEWEADERRFDRLADKAKELTERNQGPEDDDRMFGRGATDPQGSREQMAAGQIAADMIDPVIDGALEDETGASDTHERFIQYAMATCCECYGMCDIYGGGGQSAALGGGGGSGGASNAGGCDVKNSAFNTQKLLQCENIPMKAGSKAFNAVIAAALTSSGFNVPDMRKNQVARTAVGADFNMKNMAAKKGTVGKLTNLVGSLLKNGNLSIAGGNTETIKKGGPLDKLAKKVGFNGVSGDAETLSPRQMKQVAIGRKMTNNESREVNAGGNGVDAAQNKAEQADNDADEAADAMDEFLDTPDESFGVVQRTTEANAQLFQDEKFLAYITSPHFVQAVVALRQDLPRIYAKMNREIYMIAQYHTREMGLTTLYARSDYPFKSLNGIFAVAGVDTKSFLPNKGEYAQMAQAPLLPPSAIEVIGPVQLALAAESFTKKVVRETNPLPVAMAVTPVSYSLEQ